jgi:hypothetical protein
VPKLALARAWHEIPTKILNPAFSDSSLGHVSKGAWGRKALLARGLVFSRHSYLLASVEIMIFGFLWLLQSFAMSLSFAHEPWWQWWAWMGLFTLLFLLGKSYYNVDEKDDASVHRFWYQVRSLVFILDIVLLIGLIVYWLL